MNRIITIFSIFISFIIINNKSIYAQNYLAFANDNYAGVTGMFYQPASIVDSRYKLDIEIAGASTRFENNWWGLDSKVIFNPNLFNEQKFFENYVKPVDNNDNKFIFQSIEARIASFMINIGQTSSFGFSARVRQIMNMDNLSPDAAELMINSNNVPSLFNTTLDYKNVGLNAIAWAEYGFTYAQVIYKDKKHMIKAGVTTKLLQGMGSAYLYANEMNYKLINDTIAQNVEGDYKFGASANFNDLANFEFAASPALGFDFGFVYEFRPRYMDHQYKMDGKENLWRRDENKYLLKLSFSMLDFGKMNFDKQFKSNDFKVSSQEINFNTFSIGSLEALADSTIDMQTSTKPDYVYKLPTTLNVNLDIKIVNNIYINIGGRYSLNQDVETYARAHYINAINITPRLETSRFGISIPIRYNQFGDFNVGLGVRLGPVWIGSNNLLAVTGIQNNITAADIYIAVKFNIKHKSPRDDDGDFVSNKLDECDNDKGTLEMHGCPDSDGDGIRNIDDNCPYTKGVKAFNGCPDTDGDGVEDKYDKCPDVVGSKLYSGCPKNATPEEMTNTKKKAEEQKTVEPKTEEPKVENTQVEESTKEEPKIEKTETTEEKSTNKEAKTPEKESSNKASNEKEKKELEKEKKN